MDPVESRHLYKYFEAADRFVRIRLFEPWKGAPELSPELDREGYRRAVVASFIEEEDTLWSESDEGLEQLEALYNLVVEVNPELDIRSVRLGAAAPVPERRRRRSDSLTAFRKRLRRIAGDIEERLGRSVVGQPAAVHGVARCVQRAALGWERRGPLASLLLVGPTGTGKTELVRALARELAGSGGTNSASARMPADRLVRIDCSEYAEGHEYAKLLGAPPGYVGYEDQGYLTRGLEKHPAGVLLFDEIEKAHPRLHHLLLQVLDEGFLTDGQGRRLDVSQYFVVLTSNAGTSELENARDALGFGREGTNEAACKEILRRALGSLFQPELLGRLDEVLAFQELERETLFAIARGKLTELAARVRRRGPKVRFTRAVAPWVADRGLRTERAGARGIEHVLARDIEGLLAERCLAEGWGRGDWVEVGVRHGHPHVRRAA